MVLESGGETPCECHDLASESATSVFMENFLFMVKFLIVLGTMRRNSGF